uniref:Carbamoyl phosphate synthase small chain n=1 Tax=Flintiella sanguinaria TaxID=101926 RepID=A0A1X9PU50_9RHOD|nr:carbamoyl phosphate synthase small subunit [Flintiella sanguinaria]
MEKKKAILLLEDGSIYRGWSLSKKNTSVGEIVFNTGMTGYQEILTDPSYTGQIINFCYPEFGNTGINSEDNESQKPRIKGVIIKNVSRNPSNWRQENSILEYLDSHNILTIHGIDTRKLTKHIRTKGVMNCIISNEILDYPILMGKLRQVPSMTGLDLVNDITTEYNYNYNNQEKLYRKWYSWEKNYLRQEDKGKNLSVLIIDFGFKKNIAECLAKYNCSIKIISCKASIDKIIDYKPDGILLSNGPGDPAMVSYSIPIIQEIIKNKIPIFGICMGHQLLSLALGYQTFKLKFGHRGLNHPCGYNQKVEITSQNHGFAIQTESKQEGFLETAHLNLNDITIAGLNHKKMPIFSVQYHPEASPGPHDTEYLFYNFIEIIRNEKIKKIQLQELQ